MARVRVSPAGALASTAGIEAATRALEETDHTRLPSWLVASIAVESALGQFEADYERRVAAPLREELEGLRRELERAQRRLRQELRLI